MRTPRTILLILLTAMLSSQSALAQAKTVAEARAQSYPPLPDNVERRPVTIWSDGTKMAGDLYLPKDRKPADKLPAVVFISGTGGTKKGSPARMAPMLVNSGYVFLAFDYRGWGESDSRLMMLEPMPEPDEKGEVSVKARAIRWQMDFADQCADIRAAISFVEGEPAVDASRIGVIGTSYGGGLATWIAANDPRVKCAVAQVPGMGGKNTGGTPGLRLTDKASARRDGAGALRKWRAWRQNGELRTHAL